jgi:hypothetical protein
VVLLEGIREFGPRWSEIKSWDQRTYAEDDNNWGGRLHLRDQVALKDKARNMKVDFLK